MPETIFTVWTNVFERGRLQRGESILIHGGSSGIGTTAIQLARAFGARVFATAGTAEKCAACEALGAERAINYREADFVAAVREATGGRGVDVVLDMVGGEYLQRNIESLAMEGRLVQIGQLGGARAQINLTPVLRRRLTITGSTLRARSVRGERGDRATPFASTSGRCSSRAPSRVLVHATFPLREAAEAHRLMESGAHIGKLVLTTGAYASRLPATRELPSIPRRLPASQLPADLDRAAAVDDRLDDAERGAAVARVAARLAGKKGLALGLVVWCGSCRSSCFQW